MQPLYAYEDEGGTGLKIELRRTVADRDKPIVLTRTKTVPDRLAVVGTGPSDSQHFNSKMLKQYHRKEERDGARFQSDFSKQQIKKAWS
jgi:hypothetical protein